jgi:hypothetical protein
MDNVYHVRWFGSGWRVCDEQDHALTEPTLAQADAVVHAKDLARRDGSAQIVVHDEAGSVVSEFFYQRAEREALAYDATNPSLAASRPARRPA